MCVCKSNCVCACAKVLLTACQPIRFAASNRNRKNVDKTCQQRCTLAPNCQLAAATPATATHATASSSTSFHAVGQQLSFVGAPSGSWLQFRLVAQDAHTVSLCNMNKLPLQTCIKQIQTMRRSSRLTHIHRESHSSIYQHRQRERERATTRLQLHNKQLAVVTTNMRRMQMTDLRPKRDSNCC